MADKRVIIVGGGLAGLAAAIRIAQSGVKVDLFSLIPVKRSHSVCAQGGINACNEVARQQGYSEYQHFDETLYGGDYLADQAPVLEMTNWAPRIIDVMDRMGVPFNRTSEGFHDLRLFGGSLFKRTHFAGATTGQQLLYALDEQVRKLVTEGKVTLYEYWEFLWPVIDECEQGKRCVGIIAQDQRSMQIRAFRGDAVVMATGGIGIIFGKSTNSTVNTGAAASRCYQAGCWYANPEMIQIHPTSIPGADKCRLMSESARGEGGRIWVPRKKGDTRRFDQIPVEERWYFLEEKYPKYGNLVPRDIATREIFDVCINQHMGLGGQNRVYLDLTHMDPDYLTVKLGGILEIYEKFVGVDPRYEPMQIFPAVHYTMGGLWVGYAKGAYDPSEPLAGEHKPGDPVPVGTEPGMGMKVGAPENMMTNIPGLYAFGEANFAYHGATRLGANSLLSCIFDGFFNGISVVNFIEDKTPVDELPIAELYDNLVKQEEQKVETFMHTARDGAAREDANPYIIAKELGEVMTAKSAIVKDEQGLIECREKIRELSERYKAVCLADGATWTNQTLVYTRAVGDMLILADAIAKGGLLRKESRGSHYRPDYPDRDDANFLKTTIAAYHPDEDDPTHIEYREVDTRFVKPRPRTYGRSESSDAGKAQQPEPANA